MKAPFPWFGGKSRVADIVWQRFGDVPNYVEPFFGSGAVMLNRPANHNGRTETANDYDGYVSNFWRAVQHAPDEVAQWADWPVNENDLHARHVWLLQHRDELRPKLEGDPDYYDAKIAGWWVWGICAWIGRDWCSGNGAWQSVDGKLVKTDGRGVHRQLVHLGGSRGVHRQRVQLSRPGRGIIANARDYGHAEGNGLYTWMHALAERLRYVRITCGDWSRVCGPSPTYKLGLTGVFLDPPYGEGADRKTDLYRVDSQSIAADVRRWCLENGGNPLLRIALCGYDGKGHNELEAAGWSVYAWKALGGYGVQRTNGTNENPHKERIWFSPACIQVNHQLSLFGANGHD